MNKTVEQEIKEIEDTMDWLKETFGQQNTDGSYPDDYKRDIEYWRNEIKKLKETIKNQKYDKTTKKKIRKRKNETIKN